MLYFAYGSNMNHSQMLSRCPDSKFLQSAYIEEYALVYDGYSKTRNGPVANIVEELDSKVWGGLFEISDKDLRSLDRCEGYPRVYQRETLVIMGRDGKEYRAITYLRKDKLAGKPSESYRKVILQGAKDCGLPEEYIRGVL